MFDSVLGRGVTPKSRFGSGAVVSVLLHVGLLGLRAVVLDRGHPAKEEKDVSVVLKVAAPPPPPPPPPPASTTTKTHTEKKKIPKDMIIQPKESAPGQAQGSQSPSRRAGRASRAGSRAAWSAASSVAWSAGSSAASSAEHRRRAAVRRGHDPSRSIQSSPDGKIRAATTPVRRSRPSVEGLMIVRCVITAEGKVQNCRIIKPLPHMEQAVLSWLTQSKYTPVTFQGKPQQVGYVFNFKLRLSRTRRARAHQHRFTAQYGGALPPPCNSHSLNCGHHMGAVRPTASSSCWASCRCLARRHGRADRRLRTRSRSESRSFAEKMARHPRPRVT